MDPANLGDRVTLNLGSGRKYDPAAVNVDITSATDPDVVHDLDVTPWPFPDQRFERIEAIDVIEHLASPLDAMREAHRILKPGGTILIVVPHFSSANAHTDPTHRTSFGCLSFDYLTGAHHHDYYTPERFEMVDRRLHFKGGPVSRVVAQAAQKWPERYEQRWAWMFPAWFLRFELRRV